MAISRPQSFADFPALKNKCASSEVAIAGDALRRLSWHWQAVSMSMSDGSFNRLTLGSAPTRRENYTLAKISVNEFICPGVINFTRMANPFSLFPAKPRLYRHLTGFAVVPILQIPQSPMAR